MCSQVGRIQEAWIACKEVAAHQMRAASMQAAMIRGSPYAGSKKGVLAVLKASKLE